MHAEIIPPQSLPHSKAACLAPTGLRRTSEPPRGTMGPDTKVVTHVPVCGKRPARPGWGNRGPESHSSELTEDSCNLGRELSQKPPDSWAPNLASGPHICSSGTDFP